MDKNGIGTDATIHEHIKHVQEREYVVKIGIGLVPTKLGYCLVEVYDKLNIELYKPTLRAAMESDMKCIAEGTRSREQVYNECVAEMLKIFKRVKDLGPQFKRFFGEQFNTYQDGPPAGGPGNGGHGGPSGGGGGPGNGFGGGRWNGDDSNSQGGPRKWGNENNSEQPRKWNDGAKVGGHVRKKSPPSSTSTNIVNNDRMAGK